MYIVVDGYNYDGSDIVLVTRDREKAQKCALSLVTEDNVMVYAELIDVYARRCTEYRYGKEPKHYPFECEIDL